MLHGTPASRLELSFSATGLANEDWVGKSDPLVRVHLRHATGPWAQVGETEVIQNNLNPVWTTAVQVSNHWALTVNSVSSHHPPLLTRPHLFLCLQVNYFFEEVQHMRFEVVDVDGGKPGGYTGDALGTAECRLCDLVTARGSTLMLPLAGCRSARGSVKVVAEELASVKGSLLFQLAGQKLANRDWFGKSDPFFTVGKMNEAAAPVQVAKSNVVKNNLNPSWNPLKVSLQRLCGGDLMRPLQLCVWDWDADDKFDEIGSAVVNAQVLCTPGSRIPIRQSKINKEAGTILVTSAQIVMEPTFFDYIHGGVEINCSVAVDFTGSNGDPKDPRSLHYHLNPSEPNSYQTAIAAVAEILAPYDHDGLFPAFGFGGKLATGLTSHCFALNGNPQAAACAGVAGLLAAYTQALNTVSLSGPTCFAPVICQACHDAEHSMRAGGNLKYSVLLIITDGEIMDVYATLEAVVRASALPLSLIIVGVGDADFSAMRVLDCDGGLLRAPSGRVAVRDCVQFVQFNAYRGRACGPRLAADVLAELPEQLVRHFMSVGKLPPPPPQCQTAAVGAPVPGGGVAPSSLMKPI